jgi:hypothetical protein
VWFGVILTAVLVRAGSAQDGSAPESSRRLADPVVLSARQIMHWTAADQQYVTLKGDASVLQGTEGIRAKEVVVKIARSGSGDSEIRELEVYAEGQVSLAENPQKTGPRYRDRFQTSGNISLEPYEQGKIKRLETPPWDLMIVRRAGFRDPTAPRAGQAAPATSATRSSGGDQVAQVVPTAESVITSTPVVAPEVAAGTLPILESTPPTALAAAADGQAPRRTRPKRDPALVRTSGQVQVAATTQPTAESPVLESMPPVVTLPPAEQTGLDAGTATTPRARAVAPPRGSSANLPVAARGASELPAAIETQARRGSTVPADEPVVNPTIPPIDAPATVEVPNLRKNQEDIPPAIDPLPSLPPGVDEDATGAGDENGVKRPKAPDGPYMPITPGSQRQTIIRPRSGQKLNAVRQTTPDGGEVWVVRGGINIVSRTTKFGIVDLEADDAVIWRGAKREKGIPVPGPNGEVLIDDAKQPMEVYLEGNVVLRQDQNKYAGKGDQRTVRAPRMYYDFLTDRFVAPNAELDLFAPNFLAPIRVKSPRMEQFRPLVQLPNGLMTLSEHPEIRAADAVTTGSRFPNPGYEIRNQAIDITQYSRPATDPYSGKEIADPNDPNPPQENVWNLDARQNFYYAGWVPFFYWPRVNMDLDDLQPPFRQFSFNTNNYFGQQLLTDWNVFRFITAKRPSWIDVWNLDIDYLSARTKSFPALGTEAGWYGRDFIRDITDPYHRDLTPGEHITKDYFGYFELWGLRDFGNDVLGTGPAIVTNGPPGAGKAGFQRSDVPSFQEDRMRVNLRHMQRFLPDDEEHENEDLRLQVEAAYSTDRHFIEEYYKRLNDVGMDQETLGYLSWQKDSEFANLWVEGNTQNWLTDTQWLPRADYYRLGDSLLDNWFTYYQHSGADYATIHTDVMVNNPNLFAFLPYDPTTNTTGSFSSGRFYTNHEIDMPLKIFNTLRLVPYAQGQLMGWSDSFGAGPLGHSPDGALGRAWGGVGLRGEFTAYKQYRGVENELLNIHGLNNKISLFADARAAYSSSSLNRIAVQDDLDDNSYEFVRRYLAITSYTNGILPGNYDPRLLLVRQMTSPITGTSDVQASMNTVSLGLHQRLQTKRGPVGKRRIVDYMTMDAASTFFPTASRDNFGSPWGQTMYNYQWYIGDRTSIVSTGWFEFWNLTGSSPLTSAGYNPTGIKTVTAGISIQRPPRSNIYLGYFIIDSGPIKTSALNAAISYWLSPKWYGTFSQSYDFGDGISLGTAFSFTRIGADYLTTIGLSGDPQRNSLQFAFQVTPRLSGGLNSGSSAALSQFDTRFAPTQ